VVRARPLEAVVAGRGSVEERARPRPTRAAIGEELGLIDGSGEPKVRQVRLGARNADSVEPLERPIVWGDVDRVGKRVGKPGVKGGGVGQMPGRGAGLADGVAGLPTGLPAGVRRGAEVANISGAGEEDERAFALEGAEGRAGRGGALEAVEPGRAD